MGSVSARRASQLPTATTSSSHADTESSSTRVRRPDWNSSTCWGAYDTNRGNPKNCPSKRTYFDTPERDPAPSSPKAQKQLRSSTLPQSPNQVRAAAEEQARNKDAEQTSVAPEEQARKESAKDEEEEDRY